MRLVLSETPDDPGHAANWIGPLVALGALCRRYVRSLAADRQLVVAVSVPRRDFAAALLACGWVIQQQPPQLLPPPDLLGRLQPGSGVRIVTDEYLITDTFQALIDGQRPRVRLSSPKASQWMLSHIRAAAPIDCVTPARAVRPNAGSLARWANMADTWNSRLAVASPDLAVVGTLKWLREDLGALITTEEGRQPEAEDSLASLLRPNESSSDVAFSRLLAASRLAEQLPLPNSHEAVVLDGASAIKYLSEIESRVVICVIDRSVADVSAPELIVQLRNSRGEPVSVRGELKWRAPAGVEALAFTVAL